MAKITVQPLTIENWQDSTVTQLRIFCSRGFTASTGEYVPQGGPDSGVAYRSVTCTYDANAKTLSIPSIILDSTTDGLDVASARYSAWFYNATGGLVTSFDGFGSFHVPSIIASASGCSPSGACATWAEIRIHNFGVGTLPADTFYTKAQVDRLVVTQLTGAPAGATYILQTANGQLTNAQAIGDLSSGILKGTTGTGVINTAVAGTDYQAPVSATAPLQLSSNTLSITQAGAATNGYLSSGDWNTFNNKQAALGFTPENSANKNATNGYAGLTAGKLASSQMSEVIALADLTDVTGALGTGGTVPKGTFATIVSGQTIQWNGSDWINVTPATVTSVGLSTNVTWLTVSGSPVTTSGTLTFNLTSGQTANRVLATPDGVTGTVGLRALVNNDLPTVSTAKGGTGLTTIGTANQVLGVNSGASALEYKTLTAGSNITITHGVGSVTIAAAGLSTHNILSATHGDTTTASAVRGDVIVAQGTGTPTWSRLAVGSANQVFVSDGTDSKWGAVTVSSSSAVTGILRAVNGGTGVDGSAAASGSLLIGNGTGFSLNTITAGSNITITNTAGNIQIDASGTLGTAWSSLTSPTVNLSLSMSANTTTFTWGTATGAGVDMFVLKDTASNTGSGHVLTVNSATSSAAKPILIAAGGTSNGVEMSTTGLLSAIGTGGIEATALHGSGTNGFQVQVSAGNFTNRSLDGGEGISITNINGVAGDPIISLSLNTLVSSLTIWDGTSASNTITFSLSGATDPVLTLSDGSMDLTTGTLKQGGTAVALQSRAINTGTGLSGGGDLSADRTLTLDQAVAPTWTSPHIWTVSARSSGSASYFTINTPADTGITASTESIGFKTVGATRTWATGALTTQREFLFASPTYAFAGSSTLTTAATVAIDKAPVAGSNATITNKYALWVQADDVLFAGLVKAGSGPTTLTDSTGKILSAALNTVGVAQGGTGQTSYTDGQLLIGNSTGNTLTKATLTGTANRVTVTNGGGSITLSGPQDIATTSTPQFARLGLGQAADSSAVMAATGQYFSAKNAAGNTGTALTIDWNNGNVQACTATGNVTFTLNNPKSGARYLLVITQDATGNRTYTWPAAVKWSGGTAPTGSAANKVDVIGFVYDGTNYYGTSSLNY